MSKRCGSNGGSNITTLFITPRVGELRRDEILSHFSAFGDVKSVRIRNKAARSYGFVKFTHQAEALAKALETKTIAGRTVLVTIAYDRHQDATMTMTPHGKPSLLDLNDDCIYEILSAKSLSAMDLCSVAENGPRLKGIADRVFRRQHKECNLNELSDYKATSAQRIVMNFGPVISDLQICGYGFREHYSDDNLMRVLDSVSKYCGNTLKSLSLEYCNIPESYTLELRPIFNNLQKITIRHCKINGASKAELFADSGFLVELEVNVRDFKFILEKTFPKLEKLVDAGGYGDILPNIWDSFILRHPNLVSLKTWRSIKSSSLQLIADNCRRLEEFNLSIPEDSTFHLSNFGHLRKLSIYCNRRNVMEAVQGLNNLPWNLPFLESLTIAYFKIGSEFIQTLSQLKRLKVLKIEYCTGLQNLLQIVDFNQLTEIEIEIDENSDLDKPSLIKHVRNLVVLRILFEGVEISRYIAGQVDLN